MQVYTWSEARNMVHDASGIEDPAAWLWAATAKHGDVVYPVRTNPDYNTKDSNMERMKVLVNAMADLCDHWEDELNIGYPWSDDFETMIAQTRTWMAAVQKGQTRWQAEFEAAGVDGYCTFYIEDSQDRELTDYWEVSVYDVNDERIIEYTTYIEAETEAIREWLENKGATEL